MGKDELSDYERKAKRRETIKQMRETYADLMSMERIRAKRIAAEAIATFFNAADDNTYTVKRLFSSATSAVEVDRIIVRVR